MIKSKIFASLLLVAALLVLQVGAVLAAPATQQSTPITGTVQSISLETDPTSGVTTVLVTVVSASGTQTVRLGIETALALGLITLDPATGAPVVNKAAIGTSVSIDPGTVIPGGVTTPEAQQHPVGSALANFFSELLGVDYETIMQSHEDGVGFGVIAQALWLTDRLGGDTEVFSAILDAKRSGDYSAITMPDGSTPRNWGQFRKALLAGDRKANLGMIMSGRAESTQEGAATDLRTKPHGNGHGNGNGHGKNKDHGPKH